MNTTQAGDTGRAAYSIAEFCATHGISRSSFYNLQRDGRAPRLMRIGTRVLVTAESAAEWRREREAESIASAN